MELWVRLAESIWAFPMKNTLDILSSRCINHSALVCILGALQFPEEYRDPNIVKVISDQNGFALYFSRSPLPFFRREISNAPVLHHMGLYAFQREFLLKFTKLSQTPLEQAESLEQLRALEHGHKIYVTKTEQRTLEINTPEELARAQEF